MKPKSRSLTACILLSIVLSTSGFLPVSFSPMPPAGQVLRPGQSCTVFYGADGEVVLAGNNEDFINPLTYVWFVPAERAGTARCTLASTTASRRERSTTRGCFTTAWRSLQGRAVGHKTRPVGPLPGP